MYTSEQLQTHAVTAACVRKKLVLVAKFESRAAELKLCIPDLEMYTSEQLQTHAVTAACVNQSKSLFHCTE